MWFRTRDKLVDSDEFATIVIEYNKKTLLFSIVGWDVEQNCCCLLFEGTEDEVKTKMIEIASALNAFRL